jgi:hypothetical protein
MPRMPAFSDDPMDAPRDDRDDDPDILARVLCGRKGVFLGFF